MKLKDLTLIAVFAALTAVCAWITVPAAVPFTMQTFAVFLCGGLLGTRRGLAAVAVYIGLGAVGVPVFSGFGAGAGVLLGVTGGYIWGFLPMTAIIGLLTGRFGRGRGMLIAAMALGLAVCYLFGTVWFFLVYTRHGGAIGLGTVLAKCVLPFLLPDAVKMALAAVLVRRLEKLAVLK